MQSVSTLIHGKLHVVIIIVESVFGFLPSIISTGKTASELMAFLASYSTAHMIGKRPARVTRGNPATYTRVNDFLFHAGSMLGYMRHAVCTEIEMRVYVCVRVCTRAFVYAGKYM